MKFPSSHPHKQTVALLVLHLGQPSPHNSTTKGENTLESNFTEEDNLNMHQPHSLLMMMAIPLKKTQW